MEAADAIKRKHRSQKSIVISTLSVFCEGYGSGE